MLHTDTLKDNFNDDVDYKDLVTSLPSMKNHSDNLSVGDGTKGKEEDQPEHVQHGCLSVNCDLRRLHVVRSRVVKCVVQSISSVQVQGSQEGPGNLERSLYLEHGDQDDVEGVDHDKGEDKRVSVLKQFSFGNFCVFPTDIEWEQILLDGFFPELYLIPR